MRTQWDSWSRTDLETLRGMLCFCVTCWTCGLGEPCLAGPHAGGTLIVHANESIVYTDGSNGFCWQSELESCATATSTVSTETSIPIVFYVFAAFPAESNPELIAVSFGIEYDAALLSIVESGHCAEIEQHTDEWPLPGSGLVLMWNQPQHERLLELAWFAGVSQADEPSAFELGEHPTQGGVFIGDWPQTPVDYIADYGALGFGVPGYLPCPDGPVPTNERSWGGVKAAFW
jgi:hypothetical protein